MLATAEKKTAPYYLRKIQCPAHYMIPPQVDVYLREPVPELKYCSDIAEWKGKPMKIKKWRIVKDVFGNKVVDWKKIHDLGDKGLIVRPWITAGEAIERIWDPLSPICLRCKKHCHEGKETILASTIKRLNFEK